MSQRVQPVRGTKDILPEDYRAFADVVDTAKMVGQRFGFESMATPIFEFTDVFARTLGESSDIVGKEMYSLKDRGDESLTLRPEFTAGVARAFMSNGLQHQLPLKWFTTGPLFRYERPQKGRQRQFHQINFEHIGAEDAHSDVELISMASMILEALGVSDSITLEINSLGVEAERQAYKESLVEYLSRYKMDLSADSQARLVNNPLRILDSKDSKDQELLTDAPVLHDVFSSETKERFDAVLSGLYNLGIACSVNERLVRGLDYYCHTAFEFTTTELGAQNAVLAGGRYDGLIELMGGPSTPAIGFAGGVERLMALSNRQQSAVRPIVVVPLGDRAVSVLQGLSWQLRQEGFYVECLTQGNVKKRMKKADGLNASVVIIAGDDELEAGTLQVKHWDRSEEESVAQHDVLNVLQPYKAV